MMSFAPMRSASGDAVPLLRAAPEGRREKAACRDAMPEEACVLRGAKNADATGTEESRSDTRKRDEFARTPCRCAGMAAPGHVSCT